MTRNCDPISTSAWFEMKDVPPEPMEKLLFSSFSAAGR
jgi:hypothetical protein